jgi:uncharacterized protein Veg
MKTIYKTKNHLGQEVAIQLQYGSTNSKTGDGVQIWTLPMAWIIEGINAMNDDKASCFDCIHSKNKNKSCYVRKGMSEMGLKSKVRGLNSAYTEGKLSILPLEEMTQELPKIKGKFVRFGAYGEPVLLGEQNVAAITEAADNFTGYTHQWFLPQFSWAKKFFMASADTEGLMTKAKNLGWRTFRVLTSSEQANSEDVTCPASKEAGKRTTCNSCGLCKGNTSKAKSIQIIKH